MKLNARGLNSGELVSLDGVSIIQFNENNLVGYHRDCFDMGEFIYVKIPILKWVIIKIKNMLNGI